MPIKVLSSYETVYHYYCSFAVLPRLLKTEVRTAIWPYELMNKTPLKDTLINILRDVFLGKIEINSEHCLIKVNISSNITIDNATIADFQKDNESSFNYYCFLFLPL